MRLSCQHNCSRDASRASIMEARGQEGALGQQRWQLEHEQSSTAALHSKRQEGALGQQRWQLEHEQSSTAALHSKRHERGSSQGCCITTGNACGFAGVSLQLAHWAAHILVARALPLRLRSAPSSSKERYTSCASCSHPVNYGRYLPCRTTRHGPPSGTEAGWLCLIHFSPPFPSPSFSRRPPLPPSPLTPPNMGFRKPATPTRPFLFSSTLLIALTPSVWPLL